MLELWFSIISIAYIASLAIVDGLFNRLIFRDNRKLSYQSNEKQQIYKSWEWGYIGIIFLIVLPVIIPFFVAYFFGGQKYVLIYLFWLFLIQWDMIFGKLVFDNWFGDTPSLAIPIIGWIRTPLRLRIVVSVSVALVVLFILISSRANSPIL